MTSKTEQLDLDRLEALARAATPGPWSWWTSNSVLRLTGDDGIDGGVLHAYSHRGSADICCGESDRAFMAAANPAAVLALIGLARRAQPEGESLEGRIVSIDVSTGEHDAGNRIFAELTGETASDGTTLLAIEEQRNFGKPEGEAPQAEPSSLPLYVEFKRLADTILQATTNGARLEALRGMAALFDKQAAQHAESGEPDKNFHMEYRRGYAAAKADLAAQQAAAPEDADLRKDEATRLRRVVRALGIDHQVPGKDDRLRDCLFAVLGLIASKLERAAQLDGGQEGNESNG